MFWGQIVLHQMNAACCCYMERMIPGSNVIYWNLFVSDSLQKVQRLVFACSKSYLTYTFICITAESKVQILSISTLWLSLDELLSRYSAGDDLVISSNNACAANVDFHAWQLVSSQMKDTYSISQIWKVTAVFLWNICGNLEPRAFFLLRVSLCCCQTRIVYRCEDESKGRYMKRESAILSWKTLAHYLLERKNTIDPLEIYIYVEKWKQCNAVI